MAEFATDFHMLPIRPFFPMFASSIKLNSRLLSCQFRYYSLPTPPESNQHFKKKIFDNEGMEIWENPTEHPVWNNHEVNAVQKVHRKPEGMVDHVALGAVKLARWGFDTVSGY